MKRDPARKTNKKLLISLTVILVCLSVVLGVLYSSRFSLNIENPAVRRFIDTGDLKLGYRYRTDLPEGYGVTLASPASIEYSDDPGFASSNIVEGTAGANKILNLIPGKTYYYRTVRDGKPSMTHSFRTTGRVRMLSVEGIHNVRDIGGWNTASGKKIRYGYIFRGSEMDGNHKIRITAKGVEQLRNIGIRTEVDLRSNKEVSHSVYPISSFAEYNLYQVSAYMGIYKTDKLYLGAFKKIIESVLNDKPVYIHCWAGADRTGTVLALIESVLGVSKEDVIKDYELTSYSPCGLRKPGSGKEGREFQMFVDHIEKNYEGETFGEKCEKLLLELGISESELNEFRSKMLTD